MVAEPTLGLLSTVRSRGELRGVCAGEMAGYDEIIARYGSPTGAPMPFAFELAVA